MDLVCETNVWYDIAAGSRSPARLKSGGNRLLASPVSYIELVSKIDERTFLKRQGVCKAILDHANEYLVDPERHLAHVWGIESRASDFNMQDALLAVVRAVDEGELATGVTDPQTGVTYRTNIRYAGKKRADRSANFVVEMERIIDRFAPGYSNTVHAKGTGYLREPDASLLRDAVRKTECQRQLSRVSHARAADVAVGDVTQPSEHEVDDVFSVLRPYIAVYVEYLANVATQYTARPNDLADLDFFVYLQDNRRLLTSDQRWINLANDAGYSHWLLDPEASVR